MSKVESQLPTPSYTIDTLTALATDFPQHQFCLCVGADVIPQLPKWKQWGEIERQFEPIIVGRVGYDGPTDTVAFPPVSSSSVRAELSKGRIPSHLLTNEVVHLLRENNPYLEKV